MSVEVLWICDRPGERYHPGRADACERICREAGRLNRWNYVAIRAIDHGTTSMQTRGGRRVYVRTDPHITVYTSDSLPCSRMAHDGEGHFYIVYRNNLPYRLARVSELRYAEYGVNPEIHDRRRNLLRTWNE